MCEYSRSFALAPPRSYVKCVVSNVCVCVFVSSSPFSLPPDCFPPCFLPFVFSVPKGKGTENQGADFMGADFMGADFMFVLCNDLFIR
jgi:hypothetical protein